MNNDESNPAIMTLDKLRANADNSHNQDGILSHDNKNQASFWFFICRQQNVMIMDVQAWKIWFFKKSIALSICQQNMMMMALFVKLSTVTKRF